MNKISFKAKLLIVGVVTAIAALPAVGQEAPESLLPPGFGEPAAPPAGNSQGTAPNATARAPARDAAPRPSGATDNPVRPANAPANKEADASADGEEGEDDEATEVVAVFDVPPAGRRSLGQIGVISAAAGGFPVDAFGSVNGAYVKTVLGLTKGPLASRWGTILTRRFLASRTLTPAGLDGADWAAERAWLLLRMGDAVVARQLVQQVDADNYSPRLYEVSMPVFLANADLGGMCPLAPAAFSKVKDPTWKMARPICSSLAGEQGAATGLLNQARNKRWTTGVDYLLSEKAVGAGTNGRRSVKIEWENVTGFNAWRFGLAYATGIEPPAALLANSGRHTDGWRARLPMIGINSRMQAAPAAAALGVISNAAMVDIYAKALDDPDSNEATKAVAEQLESAYAGNSDSGKVAAMASIWDSGVSAKNAGGASWGNVHGMLVLTARAAALIAPSNDYGDDADRLVASMMTAGLDTNATAWSSFLDTGSLGWGILAVGAPGMDGQVSYGQLDDFYDNDNSAELQKSKLLLAALAGLGRVDAAAQKDFAEKIEMNFAGQNKWAQAISAAAARGEAGTVVLLSAVAMQADRPKDAAASSSDAGDWTGSAPGWQEIPAYRLFYITRALKQVGLEADARMIAAEAVTLG